MVKKPGISIAIDGQALSNLITDKGETFRGIDNALKFGKDYTRACIKRGHMDENRFLHILSYLDEPDLKNVIAIPFDLSEVPTWQILEEAKCR